MVDAINNQYSLLNTSPARTAAYQKAQRIIAAAAPVIPLADTGTVTVVAKGITGVSFSPGGSGRIEVDGLHVGRHGPGSRCSGLSGSAAAVDSRTTSSP